MKHKNNTFNELLKEWWCAVPLVGVVSSFFLYFLREFGIIDILFFAIIAFLISDLISVFFIRGGNGILQIPLFGSKTQPKGYGFLAFFITIIVSSIIVDLLSETIAAILYIYSANFGYDIIIGLGFSALVYLDMNARFYAHS